MMTDELFQACEFAKTAADMSIPVEPMPTPEPGSEAVDGMVNASMMDPNSVGAGTYAGSVDAAALAQAKARAAAAAQAAAAQKTAAIEEAYMMGYEDAMAEYEEMSKMASVEDAYTMGYEAALEELEKIAADDFMVIDGNVVKMPGLSVRERGEIINRYAPQAAALPSKGVPADSYERRVAQVRAAANRQAAKTFPTKGVSEGGRRAHAMNVAAKRDAAIVRPSRGVANPVERSIHSSILSNAEKPNATKANAKAAINNLKGEIAAANANGKIGRTAKNVGAVVGGLAAGAGAKYGLHKYLANKRKAKMTRNGLIGAGAAAALAGLGYAAHKAND